MRRGWEGEKEKRAKAVRKKLKAVEEVKDKQKAGTKLDAGQVRTYHAVCTHCNGP